MILDLGFSVSFILRLILFMKLSSHSLSVVLFYKHSNNNLIYQYIYLQQIYLDENTRFHIDDWERIKSYPDSRFVREVATKLWGTEGLQRRCLDAVKANTGIENTPGPEPRK